MITSNVPDRPHCPPAPVNQALHLRAAQAWQKPSQEPKMIEAERNTPARHGFSSLPSNAASGQLLFRRDGRDEQRRGAPCRFMVIFSLAPGPMPRSSPWNAFLD